MKIPHKFNPFGISKSNSDNMPTSGLVFYDSLKTTASWTTPEVGQSLTLQGSSPTLANEDGINCSYFNNGTLYQNVLYLPNSTSIALSMSVWVKCASTSTNFAGIFSLGYWKPFNCIELCQNQAILKFISNRNSDILINNIDNTKWHHIVLTYDSAVSKANCYLDKNHLSETTWSSIILKPKLLIASNASGTEGIPRDDYFNGYIAGVRLYDRVLTTDEINVLGSEFTPTT